MKVYVAVRTSRHNEEPEVLAASLDQNLVIQKVNSLKDWPDEFSFPNEGFWGTEDESVFLLEEELIT